MARWDSCSRQKEGWPGYCVFSRHRARSPQSKSSRTPTVFTNSRSQCSAIDTDPIRFDRDGVQRPPSKDPISALAEQAVPENELAHGPTDRLDGPAWDTVVVTEQRHMRRVARLPRRVKT